MEETQFDRELARLRDRMYRFARSLLGSAAEAEDAAASGLSEWESRIRGVKILSDVNLKLSDRGQKYITGTKKKIDVRGPVFTTVKVEFED